MMPGKKPASKAPRKKPQNVEGPGRVNEGHAGGHQAPDDHDPGDRLAGADFFEQQVARYLEQEIADEEDAGAQPIDRIAESQVGLHLELREADVDPVEVRKDVADEQQRNQSPRDLGIDVRGFSGRNRPVFVALINGCGLHGLFLPH